MEKIRKTVASDASQEEGAGGSLQDRINQMRRGGAPSPSRSYETEGKDAAPNGGYDPSSGGNGNGKNSYNLEDEAFLKKFEEELRNKRQAPSAADIARERSIQQMKLMTQNQPKPEVRPAAPPRKPAPTIDIPSATLPETNTGSPSRMADADLPAEGAILYLSDDEIAIFHKNIPSKNYQLVFMASPDGTLVPQGIYLNGYDFEQIGQLSPVALSAMQRDMTWDRDVLVFHLSSFDKVHLIPKQSGKIQPKSAPLVSVNNRQQMAPSREAQAEETPQTPANPMQQLCRGRRFSISMGKNRTWEAVYWGKDQQGIVVAHDTNGAWTLMHLDLERFESSLLLGGDLSDDEMRAVENSLLEKHG